MEETDGTGENHGPQKWAVPRGGARGRDRIGGRRRQSLRLDRQDRVFAVPLWRIGEQTLLRRDPFQDWLPSRRGRREEGRGDRAARPKTRRLAVAVDGLTTPKDDNQKQIPRLGLKPSLGMTTQN